MPTAIIHTPRGDIRLALFDKTAPKTVANFVKLAKEKYYDGLNFHRVIGNFMIQAGGFDKDMKQKPTRDAIPLESRNGLKNDTGMLAMARTSVPDSATSQFFINTANNASLNFPNPDGNGYAVFGKVVKGMETVEKIAKVKTGRSGPHGDVPAEPVVIQSVTRVAQ
jgi:peptidyl-prolyl cis-trans isomerase A (cyclophilin A)